MCSIFASSSGVKRKCVQTVYTRSQDLFTREEYRKVADGEGGWLVCSVGRIEIENPRVFLKAEKHFQVRLDT